MNKQKKPNGVRPARPKSQGRPRAPRVGPRNQVQFAPIAQSVGSKTMAPRINGRSIAHSELIGSVLGSVAFVATKFACNPGIAATFPWLSTIAARYEKYRFRRLQFRYKTRTATTTVGSILMAPDYDPSDDAPASEAAVSAYEGCVEDSVWKTNIICALKPSSLNGMTRFVRSGPIGGEDLKLFDVANFYLCTVEEIGADAIGKLWVDYEVEFENPQIAPTGTPKPKSTSFYTDSAALSLTTAVAKALSFAQLVNDPLGIGAGVAGVFTPPRGSDLLTAGCSFNDSSAEACTFQLEIWQNGAALTQRVFQKTFEGGAAAAEQQYLAASAVVNCNGSDTFQIQVTATGAAGTLTVLASTQYLIVQPA